MTRPTAVPAHVALLIVIVASLLLVASSSQACSSQPETSATSLSDEATDVLQAQLDAYSAEVGALGERMTTVEQSVAALQENGVIKATEENVAAVAAAAAVADAAWREWSDKQPPIPQLQTTHDELVRYLECLATGLPHLEQALLTGDLDELATFNQLREEAGVAKGNAWSSLLSAGTLE